MIIGTKAIWDFWAPRYEGLWSQKFALGPGRDLIRQHLHEGGLLPRRILDIGCGVGQLARELSRDWPEAEIVAADYSRGMIDRARKDYAAPNITYVHGSLEEVLSTHRFDLIVSTHSFPYFPDKTLAARQMRQLLEPGGRLLILQANTNNWYDWAWMRFVKLTVSRSEFLSVGELQKVLRHAGFAIGQVKSIDTAFFIPSVFMVEALKEEYDRVSSKTIADEYNTENKAQRAIIA